MCTHREDDRVALALKTREVAARCMLLYAGPYRREPPFPRRAGVVMREDQQATAEEAVLRSPYRVISKGPRQRKSYLSLCPHELGHELWLPQTLVVPDTPPRSKLECKILRSVVVRL